MRVPRFVLVVPFFLLAGVGIVVGSAHFLPRMLQSNPSFDSSEAPPGEALHSTAEVSASPSSVPIPLDGEVGQHLAVSLRLSQNSADENAPLISSQQQESLLRLQPRIIVIYGRSIPFATMQKLNEELRALEFWTPLLIAVDHEGGLVQRLRGPGFTVPPSWEELCEADSSVRESIYRQSARELRAAGIDMVLGPVLDFSSTPQAAMVSRLCVGNSQQALLANSQVIQIYLEEGILPTIKHFPGIGSVSVDLHDSFMRVAENPTEQALFRAVLERFPTIAVMTAHAGMPDEDIPCSLSKRCTGMLAEYPEALVITDDLFMPSAQEQLIDNSVEGLAERGWQALDAGADVILLGPDVSFSQAEGVKQYLAERFQTKL